MSTLFHVCNTKNIEQYIASLNTERNMKTSILARSWMAIRAQRIINHRKRIIQALPLYDDERIVSIGYVQFTNQSLGSKVVHYILAAYTDKRRWEWYSSKFPGKEKNIKFSQASLVKFFNVWICLEKEAQRRYIRDREVRQ